jgi:DNA-binding transcriptional regulator YhcF (GntR family)
MGVRTVKIVTIDVDSYEPAYVQLAGIIRAAIDAGELVPGQPVPLTAQCSKSRADTQQTRPRHEQRRR